MSLQHKLFSSGKETFFHYFLCRYIPKYIGTDRLSQSIISFKENTPPHPEAWISCAVEAMEDHLALSGSCVIRALGHTETSADSDNPRSLDKLCEGIAEAIKGKYHPEFLTKSKPVGKLTPLTKTEREHAVKDAYQFEFTGILPKRILIVDDITTSGCTLRAIIASVRKVMPDIDISLFTLAWTDYEAYQNASLKLTGNTYTWQPNEGWMEVAENSPEYAVTVDKLKELIRRDTFS